MWTKGNQKGEWEALMSFDDNNKEYGVSAIYSDLDESAEVRVECGGYCYGGSGRLYFDNEHDVRLIELAPRMAEALLKTHDNLLIDGSSHTERCSLYNATHSDDYVYKCRCPDKELIDELRRMKHGAE